MRLALFQPDIPQNTGNIIRLAACFNIEVNIIEPAGFTFNNKKLQRSAMDYYNFVKIKKHVDWHQFYDWSVKNNLRLVLLTTKGEKKNTEYNFTKNDILIFGRESAGVTEEIHHIVHERLCIPMQKGFRSLNVSSAAAIVLGEALRQLKF